MVGEDKIFPHPLEKDYMYIVNCLVCRISIEDENKFIGFKVKQNVCDKCSSPKEFGVPYFENKEFVTHEYGSESKVVIKELERRARTSSVTKWGDNKYGRLGENGKIQEKEVEAFPSSIGTSPKRRKKNG